jgi:hypothetical protein
VAPHRRHFVRHDPFAGTSLGQAARKETRPLTRGIFASPDAGTLHNTTNHAKPHPVPALLLPSFPARGARSAGAVMSPHEAEACRSAIVRRRVSGLDRDRLQGAGATTNDSDNFTFARGAV